MKSPRSGRQLSDVMPVARFAGSKFVCFTILGLAPQALCFRPLRGLKKERDQVLRIEWLFGTPENVVHLQIVLCEFDHFGNRHALTRVRIYILVVSILERNTGRNHTSRLADERIAMLHLTGFVR